MSECAYCHAGALVQCEEHEGTHAFVPGECCGAVFDGPTTLPSPDDALRRAVGNLATEIDARARSPHLRRVSKERLLEKCARDLRSLLSSHPESGTALGFYRGLGPFPSSVLACSEAPTRDGERCAACRAQTYLRPDGRWYPSCPKCGETAPVAASESGTKGGEP